MANQRHFESHFNAHTNLASSRYRSQVPVRFDIAVLWQHIRLKYAKNLWLAGIKLCYNLLLCNCSIFKTDNFQQSLRCIDRSKEGYCSTIFIIIISPFFCFQVDVTTFMMVVSEKLQMIHSDLAKLLRCTWTKCPIDLMHSHCPCVACTAAQFAQHCPQRLGALGRGAEDSKQRQPAIFV